MTALAAKGMQPGKEINLETDEYIRFPNYLYAHIQHIYIAKASLYQRFCRHCAVWPFRGTDCGSGTFSKLYRAQNKLQC
jgi:hypothetical protein